MAVISRAVPRPRGETRQRAVRVRRPTERRRSERHPLEVLVLHQRPERDGVERRYRARRISRRRARDGNAAGADREKMAEEALARRAELLAMGADAPPVVKEVVDPGTEKNRNNWRRTQEDDASRRRVGSARAEAAKKPCRPRWTASSCRTPPTPNERWRSRVHRGVKGEATGVRGARRAERRAADRRRVARPPSRSGERVRGSTLSESFRAKRAAYPSRSSRRRRNWRRARRRRRRTKTPKRAETRRDVGTERFSPTRVFLHPTRTRTTTFRRGDSRARAPPREISENRRGYPLGRHFHDVGRARSERLAHLGTGRSPRAVRGCRAASVPARRGRSVIRRATQPEEPAESDSLCSTPRRRWRLAEGAESGRAAAVEGTLTPKVLGAAYSVRQVQGSGRGPQRPKTLENVILLITQTLQQLNATPPAPSSTSP